MRAYGQDLRDKVIKVYTEEKLSMSKISERFLVCYETVRDWVNRYKTTGNYKSRQGVGGGRQLKFTDKDAILTFIKNNPDADGIMIRDAIQPDLPMSTFYDTLSRMEITFKKKNQNTKSVRK